MKVLSYSTLLLLSLSACEPTFIVGKDDNTTDPYKNFDYLWQDCKDRYSYFDLKIVDWDAVKTKYRSKLFNNMPADSSFKVMGAMLNELKDGHVNLTSNFNISFYPIEKLGQQNINWRTIEDYYLPENFYISGPFVHDFLANEQIGYLRFSSYTGAISNANLDFALSRYQKTKGIILDIRQNGGGAVSDVFNLLSRFIDKRTLLYYSRLKEGPGADDFSKPAEGWLDPHDGVKYTGKVIVLTDRGTFSAGSFTSLAIKAIPNMTLMGDTTGGGLGLPNGGQLPNGWTYRFSVTQSLTLDMDNSYELGVPPDIVAYFDWNDLTKDEVLERAMEEIL